MANFFLSTLALLGSKVARFAYVLLSVRFLGPEGWGVCATLFLVFGFLYLLVDGGRQAFATLHRVGDRRWDRRLLPSMAWGRAGAGFAIWMLAAGVLQWGQWEGYGWLQIYLSLLVWKPLYLDWLYQRRERSAWIQILILGRNLLLLSTILWRGAELTLGFLVAVELITEAVLSAASWLLLRPGRGHAWSWRGEAWLLRRAFPLFGVAAFSMLHLSGDALVIRALLGVEALGLYDGMYRFVQSYLLLASAFSAAFRSPLARYAESGQTNSIQALIEAAFRLMSMAALFFLILSSSLGKELAELVFPHHGQVGAQLLRVLALYVVLTLPLIPLAEWFLITHPRSAFLRMVAVAGIVNLVLNAILVVPFGLVAAAWVTVGVEFGIFGFLWLQYRRENLRSPFSVAAVWPLVLLGIIAVIMGHLQGNGYTNWNSYAVFGGLALGSAGLFSLTGYFSPQWRHHLRPR